jgi:hypothetical protein
MTGCCGWTASHSTRDANLLAWAVTYSWDGDLDTALAGVGRQRDQCAIPLSDANLRVARLDMPTGPLDAAWFQVTNLEQTLDDPAVSGQPSGGPSAAPRRSIIKGPCEGRRNRLLPTQISGYVRALGMSRGSPHQHRDDRRIA